MNHPSQQEEQGNVTNDPGTCVGHTREKEWTEAPDYTPPAWYAANGPQSAAADSLPDRSSPRGGAPNGPDTRAASPAPLGSDLGGAPASVGCTHLAQQPHQPQFSVRPPAPPQSFRHGPADWSAMYAP